MIPWESHFKSPYVYHVCDIISELGPWEGIAYDFAYHVDKQAKSADQTTISSFWLSL